MTVSAVNPNSLDEFVAGTTVPRLAATSSVHSTHAFAAGVMAGCGGRGLSATNLAAVAELLGNMDANEAFVRSVVLAVRGADAAFGSEGAVTIRDADIAVEMQRAGGDVEVHDITIEQVELLGEPPNSGFVDDPICAANGNFIHTDVDLVFPGTSASLDVRRHYNSVAADRVGVFGAGWTSAFDVRLSGISPAGSPASIRAHLADGATVTFDRPTSDDDTTPWRTSGRRHHTLRSIEAGWELVVGADRSEAWWFDDTGALVGWRVGRSVVEVARDVTGRIGHVTEQRSGRRLSLTWADGVVTRLTSSDGRTVDYRHGADITLTRVESRSGWFDYEYDGRLMVTATDPDGVTQFDNRYDDRGRVVEQTSPFGRVTRYEYAPGGATLITDQHGTRQAMLHDRRGNLTAVVDHDGSTMRLEYDECGRMVRTVDRVGAEWRYRFDDADNLIARVDPDGLIQRWTWDDEDRLLTDTDRAGNTTTFEYVGDHRAPSRVIGPDGSVAIAELDEWDQPTRVVDPDGVVTHFDWNDDGQLVATTDALGNRTTFDFDAAGLLTRLVDPVGAATEIEHDAAGRIVARRCGDAVSRRELTTAGRLIGETDPTGVGWTATLGDHGAIAAQFDAAGNSVGFRYDEIGNVVEAIAADGATYQQDFDEVGRLVGLTDPAGGTARRSYDSAGHLIEVCDAEGRTMRRTVDAWGRTLTSTDPDGAVTTWTYHSTGEVATVTGPDRRTWSTEVDAFGRTVAVVDPSGARSTREYSPGGRLVARITPMGRTERYEYDAAGRTSAVVGVDGARREVERDAAGRPVVFTTIDPTTGERTTARLAWDEHGRLVSHGDGESDHRIERDLAGRVLAEIDPTGVSREFSYDERGLLAAAVEPSGARAGYRHDARGRLVAQTMPGDRTTTWEYDATGHIGRMIDPAGVESRWTRDLTGLAVGFERGESGWMRRLDHAGREVERSTLDGAQLATYDYDVAGRMVAATGAGTAGDAWTTEFLWDDDDHLIGSVSPSGESRVERDRDGWAVALIDQTGHRLTIERDAAGRIVAVHDDEAGHLRLDEATERTAPASACDPAAGSRPDGDVGSGSAPVGEDRVVEAQRDQAGRLLIGRDGTLFRYDEAGRLAERAPTGERPTTFEYGDDGLLDVERGPHGTRRFGYDEAGRVSAITVVGVGTTTITYDTAGRRSVERHPDGSSLEYRWNDLDRLVGLRQTDVDGQVSTVTIDVDGLGRPVAINGSRLGYSPWSRYPTVVGEHRSVEVSGQTWNATDDEWMQRPPSQGVPLMTTSGGATLEVLGARVIDRSTHQFLSSDPLLPMPGSNGAASAYTYAWHDPVNFVDPSGLRPISIDDYRAIREREEQGRLGQAWQAIQDDPWGTLAVGALIVGATVIGGPVGAGIAIGLAATAGVGVATGTFSPTQVAIGGVVGGFTAGVGSWSASTPAMVGAGGVAGAGSDLASQALSGQPIDWRSVVVSGGVGTATAGIGGASSRFTSTAFRSGASGAATDAAADVTYQVLTGDHTVNWNQVVVSTVAGGTTSSVTHRLTSSYPNNSFPDSAVEMTRILGVDPVVVAKPDGTTRSRWIPNELTRITMESHPEGLVASDPGFNPRHHGDHFHVQIRPSPETGWNNGRVIKMKPEGYSPGSGTGFVPGEGFPSG